MATGGSEKKPELSKVLSKIDCFSTENQVERVRLLAAAVVPYGMVEDSSKKIPEIHREIKSRHPETAIPLLIRLLKTAGVSPKYVSELESFLPAQESKHIPKLYFTELLVLVSDHLGNGEYLRRLTNRIPEEKLGVASERIKTSVKLFLRLLHEDALSLDREKESLELLSRWLSDIGRRDISKMVDETIKKIPQTEPQPPPPTQEQGGINDRGQSPNPHLPVEETH